VTEQRSRHSDRRKRRAVELNRPRIASQALQSALFNLVLGFAEPLGPVLEHNLNLRIAHGDCVRSSTLAARATLRASSQRRRTHQEHPPVHKLKLRASMLRRGPSNP